MFATRGIATKLTKQIDAVLDRRIVVKQTAEKYDISSFVVSLLLKADAALKSANTTHL